jgi:hypothetical protein
MGPLQKVSVLCTLGAFAALSWACDRPAAPEDPQITQPQAHIFPDEQLPCSRLTGGGRIDKPEPATLIAQPKNTPDSRDFATFGFQARPVECNNPEGSGQLEWVEHNPDAILGGFSFHSSVNWFVEVQDHYGPTADPKNGCGRFAGNDGRLHGRDGTSMEGVSFVVEHACDRGEPGVGRDHIRICIGTAEPTTCNFGQPAYRRDGILTGGNIQRHKL